MSFDGYERPLPSWFPYFFAGLIVAGGIAYYALH
jgi:hypothetical protein